MSELVMVYVRNRTAPSTIYSFQYEESVSSVKYYFFTGKKQFSQNHLSLANGLVYMYSVSKS
jgi:hypothetical protein